MADKYTPVPDVDGEIPSTTWQANHPQAGLGAAQKPIRLPKKGLKTNVAMDAPPQAPAINDADVLYLKIKLEYLTDVDHYLFFEDSLRGGLTFSGSINYARSNSRYAQDYDPSKPKSTIKYCDYNSLYPKAMGNPQPVGGFSLVCNSRFNSREKILALPEDGSTGWFIEADLITPTELDDYCNDLWLAPERRTVKLHELSVYQRELMIKLGIDAATLKCEKLIAMVKFILHAEDVR